MPLTTYLPMRPACPAGRRLPGPLLFFFLGVVAAIESVWILRSNGFFPVDELAHFLYSRFVLNTLPVTVQTWHRPGRLWLFALPAQFGHTFTMFFCVALFLFLLFATYRIAVLMNIRHAAWAVILTGLQPVLFDISYACLAEMPAALVLALSYWAHLKGRSAWSMALASCVFLLRFEMYAFALLMFFVYARRREWRVLPLVLLGPLVWIGSSAVISGDAMAFFGEWSRFSRLGKYVPGIPVMYYMEHLHTIFGIAQALLFAAGVTFIVLAKKSSEFGILFFAIAINILVNTAAGAEVFHWTGSIGEFRYVAVVGPFVGILSAYGQSEIFERAKPPWGQLALSVIVFCIVVFNCTLTTHPRRWATYEGIVISMTESVQAQYPDLMLLTNNYIPSYVMDMPPSGGQHLERLDEERLVKYARCVVLWDPYSSNPRFFQTGLTRESILRDSSMTVVESHKYGDGEYSLFLRDVKSASTKR